MLQLIELEHDLAGDFLALDLRGDYVLVVENKEAVELVIKGVYGADS
jgi:hypothetical protein